jgi:hypothetical protein
VPCTSLQMATRDSYSSYGRNEAKKARVCGRAPSHVTSLESACVASRRNFTFGFRRYVGGCVRLFFGGAHVHATVGRSNAVPRVGLAATRAVLPFDDAANTGNGTRFVFSRKGHGTIRSSETIEEVVDAGAAGVGRSSASAAESSATKASGRQQFTLRITTGLLAFTTHAVFWRSRWTRRLAGPTHVSTVAGATFVVARQAVQIGAGIATYGSVSWAVFLANASKRTFAARTRGEYLRTHAHAHAALDYRSFFGVTASSLLRALTTCAVRGHRFRTISATLPCAIVVALTVRRFIHTVQRWKFAAATGGRGIRRTIRFGETDERFVAAGARCIRHAHEAGSQNSACVIAGLYGWPSAAYAVRRLSLRTGAAAAPTIGCITGAVKPIIVARHTSESTRLAISG